MNEFKWILYCRECYDTVGYTNHDFMLGEAIASKHVVMPDGMIPKPGDPIWCRCPNPVRILSRLNKKNQAQVAESIRASLSE